MKGALEDSPNNSAAQEQVSIRPDNFEEGGRTDSRDVYENVHKDDEWVIKKYVEEKAKKKAASNSGKLQRGFTGADIMITDWDKGEKTNFHEQPIDDWPKEGGHASGVNTYRSRDRDSSIQHHMYNTGHRFSLK